MKKEFDILSLMKKATTIEKSFSNEGKNTVILFADLEKSAYYKATHTVFEGLRKIITHNSAISDIVRKRGGNVIKWLGDGVMASFDEKNHLNSILASIEIQNFFNQYNNDKSIDDKINSRIGMSVGQCVEIPKTSISAKDLMGLPVDKAARIQSLARPGQILLDYDLKRLIQNHKIKTKQKPISEKIIFSSSKLRNLRGIGKVKIIEVRWRKKLFGINNEEDDFTNIQLKALANILTKNRNRQLRHTYTKKQSSTYKFLSDDEEKSRLIINRINNSKKNIRILSYSFSSWKDKIEEPILAALRRGVKIDILVLSGFSKFRFEKTMYESFQDSISPQDWTNKVQKIRKSYQTNLQSTLDMIKIWKNDLDSSHRDLLNLKSYDEMPILYGFMFDDAKLSFTSLFIDLVERGHNLEAFYVEEGNDILSDMLIRTFRTWFDIKFITGKELIENDI